MKKELTTWVLFTFALLSGGVLAADEQAFPGAEGFGGRVKGGCGGPTIWVTNLNAEGLGSLRAAVDTSGPRVIRFKVAGTIELGRNRLAIGMPYRAKYRDLVAQGKKPAEIENPYSFVTIDASDAPGEGITLSGNLLIGGYGLTQVVIRNLRIRDNGFVGRSGSDCICIAGSHVLIDHCSLQWARDEVVNPWYETAHDITVQWCIIGPGWGPHGYGFVNGAGTDRITLHHNLFPHNRGRNPLLCGNSRANWVGKFANDTPVFDCRNNVAYNWGYEAATVTAGAHVNLVGNMFIPGLDSGSGEMPIRATCRYQTNPTVLYLKGNIGPRRPTDDKDEWADAGHFERTETGAYERVDGPHEWGQKRDNPFPAPPVLTHSAQEGMALVLSQAGAWPRDPVDAAVVRTVLQRTGYLGVDHTEQVDLDNAKPTVTVAATAVSGQPLTVRYQCVAEDPDGTIHTCTWHFGDGLRAIGAEATHTYATPGSRVATAFAMDDHGACTRASLAVQVDENGVITAEPVSPPSPAPPDIPAATPRWQPPTVALASPVPGVPAAEDWHGAPRLTPFVDQATWKKTPEGKMDARILHSADTFYLLLVCEGLEPKEVKRIEALSSSRRDHREGRSHNGVILFFSPRHGCAPWYRFDVGTRGRRYDAKGPDRAWNPSPDWRIRSEMIDGRWHLTIAVPFAAVGADAEAGATWGAKLIVGTGKDDLCIWPPVGEPTPGRYCVPETSKPAYYAKIKLP